jgi:PKD repeat protein
MHPVAQKFMCTLFCSIILLSNYPFLTDHSETESVLEDSEIIDVKSQSESRADEPVTFTNVTDDVGLDGVNGNFFSWTDYNNDGYFDILASGWKLYENSGPPDYNFTDVTSAANLSGGVSNGVWGDYDNDGYLDLYSCAGKNGKDKLWHNNGNGTFTDVTKAAGNVTDLHPTSAAGWGDFDKDGDIDLYVANGEDWNSGNPIYFADVLYENNGDGTFTDITVIAGIDDYTTPYYGRGVSWADYDNDGWLDVYISNYRIQPNYLWRNNHDGTFTNVAFDLNTTGDVSYYQTDGPYYGHTIGSSWGDLNNDGYLDIWVSNLVHKYVGGSDVRGYICDDSNIFENRGAPFFNFSDIRPDSGIPYKPIGGSGVFIGDEFWFNAALADIDNDGDLDVFIPQGGGEYYNVSYAFSFLLRNNGDGTFTDITTAAGVRTWCTYASAWADYNEDGFPDLLTSGKIPQVSKNYEVRLYKNNGNANNWLHVKLNGTESNAAGIGAMVEIKTPGGVQIREVEGGMGAHSSQNSMPVEFGLGSETDVIYVQVLWPSGIRQRVSASVNQFITITEITTGYRITSISVDKTTAVEDEILTFNGAATGNPGHYEWDFDGDGLYDFSGSAAGPITYAYTKTGVFNARLTAWDELNSGAGFESTDYITVTNAEPTADAGTDLTVWEDEMITFNASGSTDTISDVPLLKYHWDFDDGTPVSDWYDTPLINYSFGISGNYDVTLTVKDDDGALSADIVKITVKNNPPEADAGADLVVAEDVELEFKGLGNDTPSDYPNLVYKWDFGDGTASPTSKEWNGTHTYDKMGAYNVSLTVNDGTDIAVDYIEVIVYNPVPKAFVIANFSSIEDQEVALEGWGTDNPSDRDDLDYYWDFDDGTNSGWLTNDANVTHKYLEAGIYNATLIVRDGDLAVVNATIVVTVSNTPPTVKAGADQKANEDDVVTLKGTGDDTVSDLPFLEYRWDFDDGSILSSWSSTSSVEHTYIDEGNYQAKLFVRDNNGAEAEDKLTVTIKNVDPTAELRAANTKVDENDEISFSADRSTDTPSDIAGLNYTWDFDDGAILYGIDVTHKFPESGSYNVVLKVEDDNDDSDTDSVTVSVTNVKPVGAINASTTDYYIDIPVTFSAAASTDTANDISGLTFTWDFGDGNKSAGKVVEHTYSQPGTYSVKLTVVDDDGDMSVQSMLVIIDGPEEEVDSASTNEQSSLSTQQIMAAIVVIVIVVIIFIMFLRKPPSKGKGETPRAKKPENFSDVENLYDAQVLDAEVAGVPMEGAVAAEAMTAGEVKAPFCGQCGSPGQFDEGTNIFVCANCNIELTTPGAPTDAPQLPPADEAEAIGQEATDEIVEGEIVEEETEAETMDELTVDEKEIGEDGNRTDEQ